MKLILNTLQTKRKLGFVDGTLKHPINKHEDFKTLDMENSMIIGWIYSSVEPKLPTSISLVDSAKLMWGSLQRRYSVSDDTCIHQLHANIASCKRNGEPFGSYLGKLKIMWDGLSDFEKGFSCFCRNQSVNRC